MHSINNLILKSASIGSQAIYFYSFFAVVKFSAPPPHILPKFHRLPAGSFCFLWLPTLWLLCQTAQGLSVCRAMFPPSVRHFTSLTMTERDIWTWTVFLR